MFIRTARLLLRPGWIEDAPVPEASSGHADRHHGLPATDPASLIDTPTTIDLLVVLREAPAPCVIGTVSLATRTDGATEFGAWITPSHRGRGYAVEAGRALIAAARDSLRIGRLVATTPDDAAARLVDRLGFVGNTLDLAWARAA